MRYLKATLRLLLILLVLIVSALGIYSYTSGEEIKSFLLKEINEQLLVQADVKDVEISLLQNFPNLSLILKEVNVHQADRSIINAKEVRFKFSLLDLLDRNFELHSLEIKNGHLELVEDANGNFFPKIWNSELKEKGAEDLNFELKLRKVSLSNIKLHYAEINASTEFNLLVRSAWAKGKFGQDSYELAWNSEIKDFDFYKSGKAAFEDQSLRLESICSIDERNRKLSVDMLEIDWRELRLNAKGSLDYADKVIIELSFADRATAIANYYPLLDQKLAKELDSLDFSANLKIDGEFKGELAPKFHPSLDLVYAIEGGQFINEKIELKSLWAKGKFSNPDLSKFSVGEFKADTLRAKLNGMDLNGRLIWYTSNRFPITAALSLDGELEQLNTFIDSLPFRFEGGNFKAEFEGYLKSEQLKEFKLNDWKSEEKSLYLLLNDAEVYISDSFPNIRSLNAELALGKNDLYAKSMSFEIDEMNLNYEGPVLNLISFLDDENEPLLINGKAECDALDIEKTLALFQSDESDSDARKYLFRLFLDSKIKKLSYQKLLMEDVSLSLKASTDRWMFEDIALKTLNGEIYGDLLFREESKGSWLMYNRSDFSSIDIHQLFEVFDNFGQDEIISDNIYGKASGNLELECKIINGEIDKKSLKVNGYYDIEDGRLVNYKSLYQLAKYIELEELKEIKFSRLQNQFLIEDETISLPRFSVRSSAIDLEVEGSHSFSNQIDYKISLRLAQVLGKKVKKPKESEFGYVEDDGLGKTKLFLRMQGDISNPTIKYDKEQLKDHWKGEVQKEKQTIKSILKEEFGLFKKDSSLSKPGTKSSENPPFQIEWGEEEDQGSNQDSTGTQRGNEEEKKERKKGKFGKFIDKIAKPNEEEYVYPED